MDYLENTRRTRQYIREQEEKALEEQLREQGVTIEEYQQRQEIYDKKRNSKYIDKPNTIEDNTAILFYIVVMFGGSIFNDRIGIWIVATYIFIRFMTRHK